MDVGTLNAGDAADFIVVEDLKNFKVVATYIDGVMVAENNTSFLKSVPLQNPK